MPYRTELRRPDLKGIFKCSLCNKIFCHSSSLSRHRMQAHFKSYTCTLCNKEITSNETLRAHMFRKHQISRMFMCRCCNWAFPDKTSLHIHCQAMQTNHQPGNVPVIAKSVSSPPIPANLQNHGNSLMATLGLFPPGMPKADELMAKMRERLVSSSVNSVVEQLHRQKEVVATGSEKGDGNNNGLKISDSIEDAIDFDDLNDEDEDAYEGEEIDNETASGYESSTNSDSFVDFKGISAGSATLPLLSASFQIPQIPATDAYIVLPEDTPVVTTTQSPMFSQGFATAMDLSAVCLPALRSAISSSPLNSLLYRKKLNNMLRKGTESPQVQSKSGIATPPINGEHENCPTSGSSNASNISPTSQASGQLSPTHSATSSTMKSKGSCDDCGSLRSQLANYDNRAHLLESKVATLESKLKRQESRNSSLESTAKQSELEACKLRQHCEFLEGRILQFQERTLDFLENNQHMDGNATRIFLQTMLESCRF